MIVRDANGQALAYVYFEDETVRQMSMKRLSRDEARGSPPISRSCQTSCASRRLGVVGPRRRSAQGLGGTAAPWNGLFVADDHVAKHVEDRTAVGSAVVNLVDPVRGRKADADESDKAH